MRKKVQDEKRCSQCNHVVEYSKEEEFCDWCETKIDFDTKVGYPYQISGYGFKGQGIYDLHFCGIEHGMKWFKKNAGAFMKVNRDPKENERGYEYTHFQLSINKNDLPYFLSILKPSDKK